MTRSTRASRKLSRPMRTVWVLVVAMFLVAAAWSLSGQLQRWGMADWLAWPLSIMFDAAGLICAAYARRAIERGTPAGMARIGLLGFVSVAGLLNWNHGQDLGGTPAAAGLASLSAAVELLFELDRRDIRDEQRAARGLIAERLPHIPAMGWIMYPGRSWRTLREAIGNRLDMLDPIRPATDGEVRYAVSIVRELRPDLDANHVLSRLKYAGLDTTPDTVRRILDEDTHPALTADNVQDTRTDSPQDREETTPLQRGTLTLTDIQDIAHLVSDALGLSVQDNQQDTGQDNHRTAKDTSSDTAQAKPDTNVQPLTPGAPSITSLVRDALQTIDRDNVDRIVAHVQDKYDDDTAKPSRSTIVRTLNRLSPRRTA